METSLNMERLDRPSKAAEIIRIIDECLREETTVLEALVRVCDQNGGMTAEEVEDHVRELHERLGVQATV